MLDQRFGGLRPWELERLTPSEEQQINARYQALAEEA